MIENCEVYRENDTYHVIGAVRRQPFFANEDASAAIQHALDSFAGTGGVVFLHRGDFLLHRPLRLTHGAVLRGSGPGTRLRVAAENQEGIAITGEAVNAAAVEALTCEPIAAGGAVAGIVLEGCGECRVQDVMVNDFGQHGVVLRKSCFLSELRGCHLTGNREAHVKLQNLSVGRAGNFLPNLVAQCTVCGGGKGVDCDEAIVVNIIGCQFVQNRGCAIHVRNYSCSALISGCRTFQILGDAVVVEHSHEINISANTFCWHEGHGIVLDGVIWGAVTGNNVIDSGSVNLRDGTAHPVHDFFFQPAEGWQGAEHSRDGIQLRGDTRGVNISANSVFSWPHVLPMKAGIREEPTCRLNTFTGNNVNAFVPPEGLALAGAGSVAMGNLAEAAASLMPVQAPGQLQIFHPEKLDAYLANRSRRAP